MNHLAYRVITVAGGYRVTLSSGLHFVDKQRQCSCGCLNCLAIRAVAAYLKSGGIRAPDATDMTGSTCFPCPVCGESAQGSLAAKAWMCRADRAHYWAWRIALIRSAREAALKNASPYTREVLSAFASNAARAQFLKAHALKYPACA